LIYLHRRSWDVGKGGISWITGCIRLSSNTYHYIGCIFEEDTLCLTCFQFPRISRWMDIVFLLSYHIISFSTCIANLSHKFHHHFMIIQDPHLLCQIVSFSLLHALENSRPTLHSQSVSPSLCSLFTPIDQRTPHVEQCTNVP